MHKLFNKKTAGLGLAISMSVMMGCDNETFPTGDSDLDSNSGVIAQKNFSILVSDVAPVVIDPATNTFTKTDITVTAYIGDRNNQTLTDSHTIRFFSEYGLIEPTCTTEDGFCTVTWSAIKRPDAGGPGSDLVVTIVAVTSGEESFLDTNGNGLFDDGDTFSVTHDLEEPFIDADESNSFSTGDIIIDAISTNDTTGRNAVHDAADGFFNGSGCTHTTLCGTRTSIDIFTTNIFRINGPP